MYGWRASPGRGSTFTHFLAAGGEPFRRKRRRMGKGRGPRRPGRHAARQRPIRNRAGDRRRRHGARLDASVSRTRRFPDRDGRERRTRTATGSRIAARCDHAGRNDAEDGWLGSAAGDQERCAAARDSGNHGDDCRRQEPGLHAGRRRLHDQTRRPGAARDRAAEIPLRASRRARCC